MKANVNKILIYTTLIMLLFLGLYFFVSRQVQQSKERSGYLSSIEVRDYEGEKLSSVNVFRENSIKGPQTVDRDAYRLKISGLVDSPVELSYENVTTNHPAYKKVVTLYCVEGWEAKILWEGVLVRDLIKDSRPQASANTVILHAVDGYTTSFPLSYFYDNDIILAYKMNEIELPPERGFPFQLVAEIKWGYKWIKWIDEIQLSDDTAYKGYWESRGYSNEGNLEKNFFE